MRTETIIKTFYKFDELPEESQRAALENLVDINTDYNWWDSTYEDAKNIGLQLHEFDLDRRSIEGYLIESPVDVCTKIVNDHGESCDTYILAQEYLPKFFKLERSGAWDSQETEEAAAELSDEFERKLAKEYLKMLQQDYNYRTSNEAIIETILANDYEFDANGKLA